MPSTRVKAAICRTSSGDCSRTRTLQQAPHPLQLPRSSMVGDPSRTSAARLEAPLEPPPQVVDSVRDPRESPREDSLRWGSDGDKNGGCSVSRRGAVTHGGGDRLRKPPAPLPLPSPPPVTSR